jgi:hypothetical protein
MNNNQARPLATILHHVNEQTYIAFAAVIFLVCAVMLNVYVSFSAAAVIGVITAILLLISLVG